jgi:hypothetical protein
MTTKSAFDTLLDVTPAKPRRGRHSGLSDEELVKVLSAVDAGISLTDIHRHLGRTEPLGSWHSNISRYHRGWRLAKNGHA